MRTKFLFFLFGAIVATCAYMAGNYNNLNAADKATKVDWLHVSEGVIVGENAIRAGNSVMILPDRILISAKDSTATTLITNDRVNIKNKKVESLTGIGEEDAVILFSHKGKKHHIGIQLKPTPQLVINTAGRVKRIP